MRRLVRTVAAYALAIAACLGLLVPVLRLWEADLDVPLLYQGDSLLIHAWIKGVVDNGWYLHNPYLGAPGGLDFHDYPLAESLHFFLIKLLALIYPSHGAVYNLYFLLSFPLVAVSALFVFRHFGIGYAPALAGSLLYAFLPFHMFRNLGHLFLAAYFLVPFAVMVALWIFLEEGPFIYGRGAEARPFVEWGRGRSLAAVVIGLLTGSAGVYYAVFSCFFVVIAGVTAAWHRRRAYPLVAAGLMVGFIAAGVGANLAPSLAYRLRHGPNRHAVARTPHHAENYALKVTQLLLPISYHRLPAVARFKHEYNRYFPLVNENDSAALGVIGACGFLALTVLALSRRPPSPYPLPSGGEGRVRGVADWSPLLGGLVLLNLAGVLLATVGGFGSLISLVVSPLIRGYCRISVFIGFFALFAVVLFLEWFARRFAYRGRAHALFACGLALLVAAGVYDQTPAHLLPDYRAEKDFYESDAEFVRGVEATLPGGALVFQLPYVPFPEPAPAEVPSYGPLPRFPYDHFRGYLHAHALRWSFATMKGRAGDRWCRAAADLPAPELVRRLALAGFQGIWIDRAGYEDHAAALEAEFCQFLGSPPRVNFQDRISFFSLVDYATRLRQRDPDAAWQAQRDRTLRSLPSL